MSARLDRVSREAGPGLVGHQLAPPSSSIGTRRRAVEPESGRWNPGVPFGWVAGDEVYGNDRKLRRWLEREGIPHLAIRSNEKLWVYRTRACQARADRLTSQVDELGWTR